MSQFTPRFQSKPLRPQETAAEAKLRLSPGAYPEENTESAYAQRHQETQKIKSLSFWENTDQEAGEEDEWTERQSPTPFILAIIILVVASTLLWFLFQWASGDNASAPLIIPADIAPFKVRPENPGGMMIPHQDKLIYGRLSQNTLQPIERLLPPPEQPMAMPLQQQPLEQAPLPQQQQVGAPLQQQSYYPQGYPQGHPQQQGYAPPPQGYSNPPAQQGMQQQHPPFQQGVPQPYPTFQPQAPYPQQQQQQPLPHHPAYAPPLPSHGPQSPYGPPASIPPAGPMPPLAPPPQPALRPAPSKVSHVEDIKPASDEEDGDGDDAATSDGYNELNQLIAREAETPLRRSIKKDPGQPLKLTPLDPGKYEVQIASLPSRPMAEKEMKRLRSHHGSIFENKPWNIQRVNLGPDRGVTHRLVIGSFPNHNAATKFCKKLRSEKIECLVVAPANE